MPLRALPSEEHNALRSRAIGRLHGNASGTDLRSNALRVLHDLASSPDTAVEALTLLHELQVHQVEVEMQDEELRRIRTELETSLERHIQLYDSAPVAFLTIDVDTTVKEVNRTAESMLRQPRQQLLGQRLDALMLPAGHSELRRMVTELSAQVGATIHGMLLIATPDGTLLPFRATACRDPAGYAFLLVLSEAAEP